MKKLFTTSLLALVCLTLSAQFNAGINGSLISFHSGINQTAPATQLRVGYVFKEKVSISAGYSYVLPVSKQESFVMNDPYLGEIRGNYRLRTNYHTFSISTFYHLIGKASSDFNVYIPVGAGYTMASARATMPANMSMAGESFPEASQSGWTMNAGAGAEYRIGRVPSLFMQADVALPTQNMSYNSRTGYAPGYSSNVPLQTIVSFGVKFNFGPKYHLLGNIPIE
jgi:hypothetical protein